MSFARLQKLHPDGEPTHRLRPQLHGREPGGGRAPHPLQRLHGHRVQRARRHVRARGGARPHRAYARKSRRAVEFFLLFFCAAVCVADPDPSDPYIFGPPGSGSFYHTVKQKW